MTRRETLIKKLILSLHLSVVERQEFASESLKRSEIERAILQVLDKSGRFPPRIYPWKPGQFVYEGHFLEGKANGIFRLWWQRSQPIHPDVLEEQRHQDFPDAEQAVHEFVAREWEKSEIDGIWFV